MNLNHKRRLILASSSPRRKKLLKEIGIEFEIIPSIISEEDPDYLGLKPYLVVEHLALRKALEVSKREKNKPFIVIGADTIVLINNEILGKPKDEEQAYIMLNKLSGKWHEVLTGICIIEINDLEKKLITSYEKTSVKIKKLSKEEIKSYIKTKEPMDKAGSYAIQGLGVSFIEKINGCYNNVVGLPLFLLFNLLKKEFNFTII